MARPGNMQRISGTHITPAEPHTCSLHLQLWRLWLTHYEQVMGYRQCQHVLYMVATLRVVGSSAGSVAHMHFQLTLHAPAKMSI